MIGFELIYAAFIWVWVDNWGFYMSYTHIGYSIGWNKAAQRYEPKTKSYY